MRLRLNYVESSSCCHGQRVSSFAWMVEMVSNRAHRTRSKNIYRRLQSTQSFCISLCVLFASWRLFFLVGKVYCQAQGNGHQRCMTWYAWYGYIGLGFVCESSNILARPGRRETASWSREMKDDQMTSWNAILDHPWRIDSYFLNLSDACKILKTSPSALSLHRIQVLCAHKGACLHQHRGETLAQSKLPGTKGRGVLHSYFRKMMLPGEPTTGETTVCINDKSCRALAAFCSICGTWLHPKWPLYTLFQIEAEAHFRRALETLPLLGLGTLEELQTFGVKWGLSDYCIFLASLEKCTHTRSYLYLPRHLDESAIWCWGGIVC